MSGGETSKALPSKMESSASKQSTSASNANAKAEVTPRTDDEYIRLRVITVDMTNEIQFRVRGATSLQRLKQSYCNKMGLPLEEVRFVFDGHRITDNDTPDGLHMKNNDVIETYQEKYGGM